MTLTTIALSVFKLGLGESIVDIDANINNLPLSHTVRIMWAHASNLARTGLLVAYVQQNFPAFTDVVVDNIFDTQTYIFLNARATLGL